MTYVVLDPSFSGPSSEMEHGSADRDIQAESPSLAGATRTSQRLRVSSHISRTEEESMGVELMKTMEYRNRYQLPNTSDMAPSHTAEQESNHGDFNSVDGEPEGRKRAFSVLSQTSTTASRMPPYSKNLRT